MRGYIYKVSDWLRSVHKNNCRRRNLIGKITGEKKLIGHVPCAFIYRFTEHKQWAAKCIFHDFQTTTYRLIRHFSLAYIQLWKSVSLFRNDFVKKKHISTVEFDP